MGFELTEEELKKTREYYKKIKKYNLYDEKGRLINGRKNAKVQSNKGCNEDLDKSER
jgi:hypothetical protein